MASNQPKPQAGFTLLEIVIALAVLAAIGAAIFFANSAYKQSASVTPKSQDQRSKAEQTLTNPADESKLSINETKPYSLTAGGTTYYGPIVKINSNFIKMSPTAYKAPDKNLLLTESGLNGPEPTTFFNIANITDVHMLDISTPSELTIIDALKPYTTGPVASYPSDSIDSYLKLDRYKAFAFKDNITLFAKSSTLQGNFLSSSKRVYYIPSSNGQVSLAVAKLDQYAKRTSNELLYWQNLTVTGKVAQALNYYDQTNH